LSKPGLASRAAATKILTRVIDDCRSLDGLLDTRHGPTQYRHLQDADKALARAIVMVSLRHRGEIELALEKVLDRKPPRNARHLIHTLHVAAAQILHLDVPDSAAVDLAVTALRDDKRSTRFSGLANAVLRRLSREKDQIFEGMNATDLAVMNMSPWLRKRVTKSYGKERMAAIAEQHMLEPVIDLTVRSDPAGWAEKLGGHHIFGHSIRVARSGKVETWPGYEDGEWWVQDAAASLPVHLFGEVTGLAALDLCAAPGGKTAQLASAGAQVTALESSQPRLDRLKTNMQRLRLSVNAIHADLTTWQTDTQFDLVLLDAPCSSTGTIRRHPDVQWNKSPQVVEELADLQYDMIVSASRFIKPGGTLVFSNCSIDRAEGEDIFAKVVATRHDLEPWPVSEAECFGLSELVNRQGTVRTLPCHLQHIDKPLYDESIDTVDDTTLDMTPDRRMTGLDGFFCCRLRRCG
jgi:16S rRNA (cytosine967-C5)-methyltransferase